MAATGSAQFGHVPEEPARGPLDLARAAAAAAVVGPVGFQKSA